MSQGQLENYALWYKERSSLASSTNKINISANLYFVKPWHKNPRRDAESFLSTEDYFLECFSLHSFIFLWSPEVRIVGTFSIFFLPFSLYSKISGLVYCGYSL